MYIMSLLHLQPKGIRQLYFFSLYYFYFEENIWKMRVLVVVTDVDTFNALIS